MPTPLRRATAPGLGGPIPPEHLAAARAAARESRPELDLEVTVEPSLTPEQLQLALYRKRAETAERELAKRSTTPAGGTPSIAPALDDAAVGKLVKASVNALVKRIGLPAALVATLAGGGGLYKYATDKPAPPPLTASQLDESLGKFEARIGKRLDRLTTTGNETIDLLRCQRKKVNQIGGSLLPAPDRMGAAYKPEPFEDDCPESPKRLPEPRL